MCERGLHFPVRTRAPRVYEHWVWPPLGWVLVALAAAADLGIIGSSSRTARRQDQRYYDG